MTATKPQAKPAVPASTAVRIIPCLDIADGRVVKGRQFQNLRDAGDPRRVAEFYSENGADEICFLDIAASHKGRKPLTQVLEQVAEVCFVPLLAGGGVATASDMRNLLRAGADKVSVNSAAVARPELLEDCAAQNGAQCVVLAIDARRRAHPRQETSQGTHGNPAGAGDQAPVQGWEVLTHGGRRETGREAVAWAQEGVARGAGEILLTSFDQDGTRAGFDLPLLRAVAQAVSVPVIASGGAGSAADMIAAIRLGGASAVLAASIFHDGDTTPAAVATEFRRAGLPVRTPMG